MLGDQYCAISSWRAGREAVLKMSKVVAWTIAWVVVGETISGETWGVVEVCKTEDGGVYSFHEREAEGGETSLSFSPRRNGWPDAVVRSKHYGSFLPTPHG